MNHSLPSAWSNLHSSNLYDDEDDRLALLGKEHDILSVDVLRGHRDPFYNECRVYGRLIDADFNGKVVVRGIGLAASSSNQFRNTAISSHRDRLDQ